MKLKILTILLLISLLLAGCIQENKEITLEREAIELKMSELNNSTEINNFSDCSIEFNNLLSEPYPKIDNLNAKYYECKSFEPIILEKTDILIEFIENKIGVYTLEFDKELSNYINNIVGIKMGVSGSISKMKLDMINLTFNKITQTCIKEENALLCTECCQNNFDSEALNYYNKCKLECLILEE